ncbi:MULTISPECIES: DoxX family protein [Tsukamurella]|uniref:DoxX family protein n=1 Tax=Tsukamurella strandjordii TaxID=147577 RepID=A0AA90NNW2_9ACTN|nr:MULTISPECIES: DoxX family protein [Tsukamurella]MDP0397939.1 DoxX family protein [Tsukamurella strandjordii]GIZ98232.1 membrane protein [Tsukamurella sp. TY48]
MVKKLVTAQFFSLTTARIILGIVFVAHGWRSMFTVGPGQTGRFFESLGIPLPNFFAWVVGLTELFGGALLILGLAVPLVAVALIIDMLVAMFTVHIDKGFFSMNGGIELNLVLIAGLLAVAAVPQTSLGLDALILKKKLESSK